MASFAGATEDTPEAVHILGAEDTASQCGSASQGSQAARLNISLALMGADR
jgi:hypothetical protein